MRISDLSSDVCSSDLSAARRPRPRPLRALRGLPGRGRAGGRTAAGRPPGAGGRSAMIAPNAAPDYGSSVFAGWRLAAAADWQAYTRHDFVRRLGDGRLPRAPFLHYLVQD